MRLNAFAFDAARSQDDLLGTCYQVPFWGILEIKFHQQAQSQLIASNPKTLDPNILTSATKKGQPKRLALNLLQIKIRLREIEANKILIRINIYIQINSSIVNYMSNTSNHITYFQIFLETFFHLVDGRIMPPAFRPRPPPISKVASGLSHKLKAFLHNICHAFVGRPQTQRQQLMSNIPGWKIGKIRQ